MTRIMEVENINFKKLFRDIRLHVDVGVKLYRTQRTEDDAKFNEIFYKLDSALELTQKHQEHMITRVSKYDFVNADDSHVKANGYRSMLYFASCVLQPLHQSLQKAAKDRSSFRYSPSEHISSLYQYCSALQSVEQFLHYSCKLMDATPSPDLFNNGDMSLIIIKASITEYLSRDIFYGRLLGLQYAPTIKPVLKMLGIGMASYEEWYRSDKDEPVKQLIASLWKGSRYLQSPTRLGLKLDYLTLDSSVHFVKAFWSLAEQNAFKGAVKLIGQSVEICTYLEVPAVDIKIQTDSGEVTIEPPSVHLGYKPIPLYLLSYKWRGSQPYDHATKKQAAPLSPNLLVHIHGGGYVAQTPQSHEFYLRRWSFDLDAPIVSIDYSLSPEAPYPRALEECVMAYCWMLQNLELLGTTGERIMFMGDSAGGNFVITTAMKLKELGIRLPDAILSVYPSTNITSSASPSRIMGIVDPILPVGTLIACQQAYSNQQPTPEELSSRRERRRRVLRAKGYYLPDPEASSSSWKERPASIKRKWFKSKDKSREEEGSEEMASVSPSSKPKLPPPRPPPPSGSETKVLLEAATKSDEDSLTATGTACMIDVPLDAELSSVSDPHSSGISIEKEELQEFNGDKIDATHIKIMRKSKIPFCFEQEPEEEDKLSPAKLEELVEEVMKGYRDKDSTKDPFMSPIFAPDELLSGLPPIHIIGASLDSLLDDAVSMAQRLKSIQQPVTFDIAENLPHGFLALVSAGNNVDMNEATKLCLNYMKLGLNIPNIHTSKK